MSTLESHWDLDEIEISKSAEAAALRVVRRLTRDKDDMVAQWLAAMRLAQDNGASLRQIAEAAGVSPQTVANLVNGERRTSAPQP